MRPNGLANQNILFRRKPRLRTERPQSDCRTVGPELLRVDAGLGCEHRGRALLGRASGPDITIRAGVERDEAAWSPARRSPTAAHLSAACPGACVHEALRSAASAGTISGIWLKYSRLAAASGAAQWRRCNVLFGSDWGSRAQTYAAALTQPSDPRPASEPKTAARICKSVARSQAETLRLERILTDGEIKQLGLQLGEVKLYAT